MSLSAITKIECVETRDNYGRFVAEPLDKGFGMTLGNALRRVLLGHLPGAATASLWTGLARSKEVVCAHAIQPRIRQEVFAMDGSRSPSACDRIVKVGRRFEWSRLENEVMTSAYEQVLPLGRWARAEFPLASRQQGYNAFGRSDCDRPRYATGA